MDVNGCTFKGKEYSEVDRIDYKGKVYAFLVNDNDEKDFMVRVVTTEESVEYYDPIKNENEFKIALMLFLKKNANLID